MNIRTDEQLYDYLSRELAWRKKELADLKGLIQLKSSPKHTQDVFIRSGIALLYAHWEGFIKSASVAYLEFVSMKRLTYQELAPNFVAIAMKTKLNQAQATNKAAIFVEVSNFFLTNLSERCSLQKNIINTKSNLSSEVLKDIITLLGLDYSEYSLKEKLIDETLLRTRNNIAHGQYMIMDSNGYLDLHEQVIEMLNLFRNQIDNSATLKKYRRST